MDRQEGDDELPRAPEIASVDAGKPGCRRPLPARIVLAIKIHSLWPSAAAYTPKPKGFDRSSYNKYT